MISHLGADTRITIGGKTYTLSRYTRYLLFELVYVGYSLLKNPLTYVTEENLSGMPDGVARMVMRELQEGQYGSLYCPEFLDWWISYEGRVKEFSLLLRKYHPDSDGCELYLQACAEQDLPEKVLDCMGRMPVTRSEAVWTILAEWGLMPGKPQVKNAEREDWLAIDKILAKNFQYTPEEIWNLTVTEIHVLLQSLQEKEKTRTYMEVNVNRIYRELSPLKRLELERRLAT